MTDIQALYEAELKQSEIDHHVPTAGAMTNHILSNLMIENIKLAQINWYIKGFESLAIKPLIHQYQLDNAQNFDQLGELLIDEDQKPSSTTDELKQYSMLQEDGANKYLTTYEMIYNLIQDFNNENLFVTRAIPLAQKEDRPALTAWLINYLGQNNHKIRQLQNLLGNTARVGLDEEDDDDE